MRGEAPDRKVTFILKGLFVNELWFIILKFCFFAIFTVFGINLLRKRSFTNQNKLIIILYSIGLLLKAINNSLFYYKTRDIANNQHQYYKLCVEAHEL